jgi:hypothetical protein
MFVPGKPFHPSLMLVGKAGAYPRVEHLKFFYNCNYYCSLMFVTVSLRGSTVEVSKVSNYLGSRGSTVVEHSPHNYKVEGSNPTAATRSLKM